MRKLINRLQQAKSPTLLLFGNILCLAILTAAVVFGYASNQLLLPPAAACAATSLCMLVFAVGRLATSLWAERNGDADLAANHTVEAAAYWVTAAVPGIAGLLV